MLGWLPRIDKLKVAERHLGLIPTIEPGDWDELIQTAADSVRPTSTSIGSSRSRKMHCTVNCQH